MVLEELVARDCDYSYNDEVLAAAESLAPMHKVNPTWSSALNTTFHLTLQFSTLFYLRQHLQKALNRHHPSPRLYKIFPHQQVTGQNEFMSIENLKTFGTWRCSVSPNTIEPAKE